MLGIVRPGWLKVTESECRQIWLEDMIERGLIVRDVEAFASSVHSMLRSEKLKIREEGTF